MAAYVFQSQDIRRGMTQDSKRLLDCGKLSMNAKSSTCTINLIINRLLQVLAGATELHHTPRYLTESSRPARVGVGKLPWQCYNRVKAFLLSKLANYIHLISYIRSIGCCVWTCAKAWWWRPCTLRPRNSLILGQPTENPSLMNNWKGHLAKLHNVM